MAGASGAGAYRRQALPFEIEGEGDSGAVRISRTGNERSEVFLSDAGPSRFPRSHRSPGWLPIGADQGVFERAAVDAAITFDVFSGTHAVRLEEAFPYKQPAASYAQRRRHRLSPSAGTMERLLPGGFHSPRAAASY